MINEENLKTWEQEHIELLTSREMGEWLYRRDLNARPQGEWIPIKSLTEDNHHSRLSFRCNQCRLLRAIAQSIAQDAEHLCESKMEVKNAGVL